MSQPETKHRASRRVSRPEEKQWARSQGKSKRPHDWATRQCNVVLTDMKYDKSLARDGEVYIISDERKKNHTCYICMAKFSSHSDLDIHKNLHNDSDVEDDLFEEEYGVMSGNSPRIDSSSITIDEKVKNLDVLVRVPDKKAVSPIEKAKLQNDKEKSNTESPDKIKPPFKCVVCEEYFETSDEAKKHLPKDAKEKCKFSCHLCNRKFNTLYAFVVHMMQHKTNIVKNQLSSRSIYTCSICEKTFSDCFQLKRHEITIHKKKTVSQLTSPTTVPAPNTTTGPPESECMVVEENEAETDFTCELCYDIFTTKEELDSHTDFHKQLERISEPVITDDVEVTVEVIEDLRDKHGVVTTIQKAQTNNFTRKINTIDRTYDKFTLGPNPPSSTVPKQKLTAKIKEMIAPKSAKTDVKQKPSKTIFLPTVQPRSKVKPGPKPKPKTPRKPSTVEVQRTSPTSFSVVYPEANIPSSSTSVDVTSNMPSLYSAPFAQIQPQIDGNDAKKVAIPRIKTPRVEPSSAQVLNTSTACSSAPGLFMNPVSNPGLSYMFNAPVPTFTSHSLNANTVVSLSNSNSITTPSVAPSNTQYAYVVIPNSVSPNISAPSSVQNSSNVNNFIPAVNEALRQHFSGNVTQPSLDPPLVPPQLPPQLPSQLSQNDTTSGGMTMPVIYNVMSLNESVKQETIGMNETNTTATLPQVKSGSLDRSESLIDTIVNTEMSNFRPILPAPVVTDEIICLDSDSDAEETTNESAVPAPSNDSDEGENLVIDDSAASQSSAKGEGTKKEVIDAIGDSKDTAVDDKTKKTGKSGKEEKEKKWNFPVKCGTCNARFQRYRSMRLHNERKVACNECTFKCCRTIELKNHYLSKHRIFYCWRCNFQTKLQSEFVEHRKFHTCEQCGGVFVEMTRHTCKKNKKTVAKGSDSPITVSE